MKNDGTTPSGDGNGSRRARSHQRLRRALGRTLQWRRRRRPTWQNLSTWKQRPLWQEPVRGALYVAGSGIIGLTFAWFQHWL
ncbi:hypothetical protein ACGFSD_31450 [Streptomyces caniferus]|uniref:hypothetical protein n=1 Tax=Streptomyces caniferus TaxID=285557 RepID=UPI00371944C5